MAAKGHPYASSGFSAFKALPVVQTAALISPRASHIRFCGILRASYMQ